MTSRTRSRKKSGEHDGSVSPRELWRSFSDPRKASVLAWVAFLVTWVITRAITIHGRGSTNAAAITIAGHHVHHFVFGMILMGLAGAAALFWRPAAGWIWLGAGYGVGLALILDEYALLLNLRDVYWQRQGRLSVAVVVGFIAVGGIYLTAMTLVHASVRRARKSARRRIRARRADH